MRESLLEEHIQAESMDMLDNYQIGTPVRYNGENSWEIFALDKRPGCQKPIGIARGGFRETGKPVEKAWVSPQELN